VAENSVKFDLLAHDFPINSVESFEKFELYLKESDENRKAFVCNHLFM